MRNKFTMGVIAILFLVGLTFSPAQAVHSSDEFPEKSTPWYDKVVIEFGITSVLQNTSGNSHEEYEDVTDYAYSVDLAISADIEEGHTLNLIFEAGEGDGANDNLGSRAVPNYDSFISSFEGDTRLNVTQAYYEGLFFDEKLTLIFGKIDHHSLTDQNEYAGNETEQFINGFFVRSAGLVFAEHHGYYALTFSLSIKPVELVTFTYNYAQHETEDVLDHGYHIAELAIHPNLGGLPGNYRFAYIKQHFSETDEETNTDFGDIKSSTGINISIDQAVTEELGLFFRYASQDDSIEENEVSSAISGGVSIGGGLWGRDSDTLGIGYGKVELNKDVITEYNEGESVIEAYYRIGVNDHLSVTADIQMLSDLERPEERDVFVFGLRMQVGF